MLQNHYSASIYNKIMLIGKSAVIRGCGGGYSTNTGCISTSVAEATLNQCVCTSSYCNNAATYSSWGLRSGVLPTISSSMGITCYACSTAYDLTCDAPSFNTPTCPDVTCFAHYTALAGNLL